MSNTFFSRIIAVFALIISFTLVFSACSQSKNGEEASSSLVEVPNNAHLENDGENLLADTTLSGDIGNQSDMSSAESTVESPDSDVLNYKTDTVASVVVKNTVVNRCLKIESVGESDGFLCITVRNVSQQDIEYCVLTCKVDGQDASFSFSVLPADASAVAKEQNDLEYKNDMSFSLWCIENRVDFEEQPSVHEDLFDLQYDGGAIEIRNKTANDLTGKITVCYKTLQNENLYCNNAYRVSFDGLKVGEVKQLFPKYFNASNSRVVYIQYDS